MPNLLDIVVTRHNEPWKVGKGFFDMLQHQSCVSPDEYTVTVVDSGKDKLPWEDLLTGYSYPVRILSVNSDNISVVRNVGLKHTHSAWIMFFDFDDMFADVAALRMILDQFPVNDYDLIWCKAERETKWNGANLYINCVDEANFSSLCGKIYRRKFLEDKHITFDSAVPLYSDHTFNCIVLSETTPFRIVTLSTVFYVHHKKYRKDGISHDIRNIQAFIDQLFDRNVRLAELFRKRNRTYDYYKAIMSVVFSEYFRIFNPETEPNPCLASDRFMAFYNAHKSDINRLSVAENEVIMDAAETEAMGIIQSIYNDHKKEYYLANDAMTYNDWLSRIDGTQLPAPVPTAETHDIPPDDTDDPDPTFTVISEDNNPVPVTLQDTPRVAVYCGTYNTYMSMMTSAKSLLYHTRMDKIYFLIEDDTFPYDLPDIIECINVKNQSFFPSDGPNYNNSWSYMCMMRAAFTKLIPYEKILSLDIDVIVQEDIGCLWDIDMDNYYLAGVPEPQRRKSSSDPLYINFGVVIMNLAKLRKDHIDDTVINALNTNRYGCPEQDAFNHFCAWHILQLDNDYNATIHSHITGDAQHERIIHYAGIKFWRHYSAVKQYSNIDWDIIMSRQNKFKEGET